MFNTIGYPRLKVMLLQAMHEEAAVSHAVMALSSQYMGAYKTTEDQRVQNRVIALRENSKCMNALHRLFAHKDLHGVEAGLLCAMICIVFELLSGEWRSAHMHLEGALRIIDTWPGMKAAINL